MRGQSAAISAPDDPGRSNPFFSLGTQQWLQAVRLRRPTDVLLLEALAERRRNVPPNLPHLTGTSRKNSNTGLPVLARDGLIERVGPVEHFVIGEAALAHRDRYGEVEDVRDPLRISVQFDRSVQP